MRKTKNNIGTNGLQWYADPFLRFYIILSGSDQRQFINQARMSEPVALSKEIYSQTAVDRKSI